MNDIGYILTKLAVKYKADKLEHLYIPHYAYHLSDMYHDPFLK